MAMHAWLCLYAYLLICSFAYMLIYIFICSYVRMLKCAYAHVLIYSYVCSYAYICAHMLKCSYAYMFICLYAHWCVHMLIRSLTYSYPLCLYLPTVAQQRQPNTVTIVVHVKRRCIWNEVFGCYKLRSSRKCIITSSIDRPPPPLIQWFTHTHTHLWFHYSPAPFRISLHEIS